MYLAMWKAITVISEFLAIINAVLIVLSFLGFVFACMDDERDPRKLARITSIGLLIILEFILCFLHFYGDSFCWRG